MRISEKEKSVLEELQKLFDKKKEEGEKLRLLQEDNAPQHIAEVLGLEVAEVLTLLRQLQRKNETWLLTGIGQSIIAIAASKKDLPVLSVAGGNARIKDRAPASKPAEESSDTADPLLELNELRAAAVRLELENQWLVDQLRKAENRRQRAADKEQEAQAAKSKLEQTLKEAKAAVRALQTEVENLRGEANKIPGLEQKITELEASQTVSGELVARIDRLTGVREED